MKELKEQSEQTHLYLSQVFIAKDWVRLSAWFWGMWDTLKDGNELIV